MTSLSALFLARTHSVHSFFSKGCDKGTLDTHAPGRAQTEKQACGGAEGADEKEGGAAGLKLGHAEEHDGKEQLNQQLDIAKRLVII
jgi:hypothetical protein